MSTEIKIEFKPQGFAECLEGMSGTVQAEAEKIAARASSYLTKGSGFHVEMTSAPRYQDASYGVARPVAYVVANDDESSKEEAENKILSKAVGR
jgi:hypothetical protein